MNMKGLCLHTGSSTVNREQVERCPTPPETKTWVPVSHRRVLEGVQTSLEHSGLRVVEESHGLSTNGDRYFGLLRLENGHASKDFSLVCGVRNSHDKKFPAGIVVGASVFVCDNLSFSGEIKLARRHTRYINRDFPQLIERAVGKLGDLRSTQENRFLAYQQTEFTDHQAHDLVIQALDSRVIPVTKIPAVLKEWREPSHPEFTEGGKTAWRLFNAFSEVLKGALDYLPFRTQAAHGLFDTACGIVVPATINSVEIRNQQAENETELQQAQ